MTAPGNTPSPGAEPAAAPAGGRRETFASRAGSLMTIVGVSIGLGKVWRFPYMAGKFGGAAFVLFYVLVTVLIGLPALMAEFALGRHTRRGPVGAFEIGGFPFGRQVGWLLFVVVTAATAYYTAVIGWVLYHAIGQLAIGLHIPLDASAILPPDHGFAPTSFLLQLACTGAVVLACAVVLLKGVRSGIERASKRLMPVLFGSIVLLMIRALTLPGAGEGVRWYILKFQWSDLTANVMMASLGQAIFSLSLGGTFMVVYGSYLDAKTNVATPAIWTVVGDLGASLLAGFAVIPAVFAFGLQPKSGPALIFTTLPKVFAAIPAGWLFGFIFFGGLVCAGYLSDIGGFEALIAGLTDNTRLSRKGAVWAICAAVFLFSIPPSVNNAIFVPWDLTFGSGMQTLGSLLAVITIAWCVNRSTALRELGNNQDRSVPKWLFYWIRFGIPAAIVSVGVYWLLSSVVGAVKTV